jgi:4-hydroxy-tetrahydrodipicolinate reductase
MAVVNNSCKTGFTRLYFISACAAFLHKNSKMETRCFYRNLKGRSMKPKLVIVGAAGRMGQQILSLCKKSTDFDVIAAVEAKGHPQSGKDTGINGVKISSEFPQAADVVIEFALPDASEQTLRFCVDKKAALVMGTTGLSAEQKKKVEAAAKDIPVIYGTNMSVGMNVLFSLAGKTAAMLGDDYDIEIIEQHHKFKKDAPSGSALTLAENICKATGRDLQSSLVFGRHGKDEKREKGTIGIHSIRAGGIAGRHQVIYSNAGETITLGHIAHGREGFAQGALCAAKWLISKEPGLYTMADVLKLK